MAAVTVYSDFGTQEEKICHFFHFSPSICHEVIGLHAMIFVFWMLSFKPTFSLSSSTLIKRFFLVPLLFLPLECYHLHIRGCWYFCWKSLFLIVIHLAWHLAWYSLSRSYISRWQFTALMYSFPNFKPVCCSMSGSNCWLLTWTQVSQGIGKMVWYFTLFLMN